MPSAHSQLLERVLLLLDGVKREGDRYKARCPAHTDSTPSLSVRLGDRGVLLRCFAGCTHEDVVRALGMRTEELFFNYDPEHRTERPVEQADPTHELGLTLAALCEYKGLDPELCDRLGVRDAMVVGRRVVTFAYPLRDGTSARLRIRATLTGQKRFRWEGGDTPIAAYEPDLGVLARARKTLCVVEGESDTLTLLSEGFGALGIPGADCARVIMPHHLEGIDRAFVIREPDKGGDTFARNTPAALERAGFAGKIITVRMPEGTKDVSALYLADRKGFAGALQRLLDVADPPRAQYLDALYSGLGARAEVALSGFGTLDRAMDDGGLPFGSLMILAGGPGSKKTGLAVHLGDTLSRQGASVLFMCADEGRKNIVSRFGQRMGFSRAGLRDTGDIGAATRAEAIRQEKALSRTLSFVELEDEQDAQTLEDAYIELLCQSRGKPRVLVVDSLQTVRCAAAEALDRPDPRTAIDAKLRVLKSFRREGTLVIVVSETRRGFYSGDKPIAKEDVLSAAKESGGVEYGADLVLGLVRDRVDEDLVQLIVAKSRCGQEPRFSLRWDRRYATLTELEPEAEARARQDREDKTSHDERRESLREAVYELVERRPGLTRTQLRAVLKKGRVAVNEAIDELSAEGRIVEQKNGNGARSPIYTQDALLRQERGE
jgi:KaiC/GvpD/RAD55 family RecA-like ATPase/biotin operon repressor